MLNNVHEDFDFFLDLTGSSSWKNNKELFQNIIKFINKQGIGYISDFEVH